MRTWLIQKFRGPYGQGHPPIWALAQALDQQYSAAPWPAQAWPEINEHYELAVVCPDKTNEVQAFGLVRIGAEQDLHLLNLTVHPAWRQQGLGEAILSAWQEGSWASIYLEVDPHNAAAVGLYTKRGFKTLCVKKAFYADGRAAVAMQWAAPGG